MMASMLITAILVALLLKQFGCNCSEATQNIIGSNQIRGQPGMKLESGERMNKTGNILFVYAPINAKSHLHSLLPIAKKFASIFIIQFFAKMYWYFSFFPQDKVKWKGVSIQVDSH